MIDIHKVARDPWFVRVAGALLSGIVAAGGSHVAVATPSSSVTFDQPGAYTWTVPAGVRYATFDVYGASGGEGYPNPGLGAHVHATIAVTSHSTLTILVGGRGGFPEGGFGGGGPGGHFGAPFGSLPGGGWGGGGGGASDVRTGAADPSSLPSRLLVAGGGGGATPVAGGDGGEIGEPGADGPFSSNFLPATSIPGGGGGTANGGGTGSPGVPGAGTTPGSDGALGTGGAGGDALDSFLECNVICAAFWGGSGGGGGGGGRYGGGGGASAGHGEAGVMVVDGTPSGGGGGSSLITGSVCQSSIAPGVQRGDGMVSITYRRGASLRQACG